MPVQCKLKEKYMFRYFAAKNRRASEQVPEGVPTLEVLALVSRLATPEDLRLMWGAGAEILEELGKLTHFVSETDQPSTRER